MSQNTRTSTQSAEHLRFIYLQSSQTAKVMEKLLQSFKYDEEEDLQIAISDARNVMSVLAHRTASKLGLPE